MSESPDVVRVFYYRTSGLARAHRWWAQSPDLPGWKATGGSYSQLCALAEDGIRARLGRADVEIQHQVRPPGETPGPERDPGESGSAA